MQQASIGVFDSGVGGLSVLAHLHAAMPHEHFDYLADTAHVPYGERSEEQIRRLTRQAVSALCSIGVKAVVVACNTASVYSLTELRQTFAIPIFGLVPAVKPAVQASQSNVIGVLATPRTLRGAPLQEVIEQYATPQGVQVLPATHPQLVPLIEAGQANSVPMRELLTQVLRPLAEAGADQLVLGCTHFPFLAQSIQAVYPHTFTLVDSGEGIARHTKRVLTEQHLAAAGKAHSASHTRYWVTGEPARSLAAFRELSGQPELTLLQAPEQVG